MSLSASRIRSASILVATVLLVLSVSVPPAHAALTFGATTIGTGSALDIDGVASSAYTFGASTTTGSIAIGGVSQTGNLTLGQSTASNTIAIGNANTLTGETQTINLGAGTPAGTGKALITIGNTNGASALTLQAGTGGISASTTSNAAGAITLNTNGGTSETVLIRSQQGTAATSLNLVSTAGGITLNASGTTTITNNASVGGTLTYKLPITALTTTTTLTAAQSGGVFSVSQSGSYTITLPAVSTGLYYRFISLGGGSAVTIASTTTNMYGTITDTGNGSGSGISSGFSGFTNVVMTASAPIGAYVEIIGISGSLWLVRIMTTSDNSVTVS